jgi:hypothetical protein
MTYQPTYVAQAAAVSSSNAYALSAFGFSLVGAVGLSVICAIAALCQIKTAQEGRGLAIAGLVASAGWIALFFALAHSHVI